MNLACRLLGALAASLIVACGGGAPVGPGMSTGDVAVKGTPDAGPADVAAGSAVSTEGNDATVPDLVAPDARPDAGRDGGDAAPDPTISPRMCTAGHTCTGNTRCMRSCFGGLVSRCTCAEGHFVCTGCISVDGGAPDAKGPALCAAGVTSGRRCTTAGAVCQQRADAESRLCVCGELSPERVWICQ